VIFLYGLAGVQGWLLKRWENRKKPEFHSKQDIIKAAIAAFIIERSYY
jgi:hypothetical protein